MSLQKIIEQRDEELEKETDHFGIANDGINELYIDMRNKGMYSVDALIEDFKSFQRQTALLVAEHLIEMVGEEVQIKDVRAETRMNTYSVKSYVEGINSERQRLRAILSEGISSLKK